MVLIICIKLFDMICGRVRRIVAHFQIISAKQCRRKIPLKKESGVNRCCISFISCSDLLHPTERYYVVICEDWLMNHIHVQNICEEDDDSLKGISVISSRKRKKVLKKKEF